ncbi:MAG: tetratricopeptide repeat protein [Verrucomicrobia bacterium]|nr:tetratricopeptide repeat protein [Verrucomicrobiota bacterium]
MPDLAPLSSVAPPLVGPLDSAPRAIRLAAVALVAAIALAYGNTLRAPFLFDDAGAVLNNLTIRRLGSLAVLSPPADGSTTTGRPVVNASYALNYAISGENVWGYHLANVAIHALAALALLGIVRRTLAGPVLRGHFGGASESPAFLTALLWALHPLQTESVTCIAQRTESLCGLFYLLTISCFIRATVCHPLDDKPPDRAGAVWLTLSVASSLAGMGTKEVMATAPLMVLLYDRTFVAGNFTAAWRRRRTYYFALAGTWLLLAWLIVRSGGGRGASAGFGLGVSWWTYLLKQCEAILLYLKLSIWPHPLVFDYGTAVVNSLAVVGWQAVVVCALLAAAVWSLARKPVAGFLGAWFFLILAPSSSVVPLVTQTMAEHRMYLPLAGVLVLVVVALFGWIGPRATWLLAPVAIVLGCATVFRNRDYRDAVTIWSDTVARNPTGARAHNNLALALQQQGKPEQANVHFARAVKLQAGYVSAHYNWGSALLEQGRVAEAIAQLQMAVRLAPNHADAHVNLGNALVRAQQAAEAVRHYREALQLKPAADVYYNAGIAFIELGRSDDAAEHFRAALQLNPNLPGAHYQLAGVAERAGRLAEAEREYEATLRGDPDHVAAHRKLGLLLARSERLVAAATHFRAVIRLQPADADAHANLGNAFLLGGQVREAVACYEESLRLRPGDARTRENLQLARESLR